VTDDINNRHATNRSIKSSVLKKGVVTNRVEAEFEK